MSSLPRKRLDATLCGGYAQEGKCYAHLTLTARNTASSPPLPARQNMQPFYQGKIDNFCAMYAVLNAVQIVHELSPGQARNIFNLFLFHASRDEKKFWDILTHKTDYTREVDQMLEMVSQTHAIKAQAPFHRDQPCAEVWRAMTEQVRPEEHKTVLFRFCRYSAMSMKPKVDHWTSSLCMDEGGIRLFDCSLEPDGLYHLKPEQLKQAPALLAGDYFVIPPESVRFLSRA